jgi:hypothetical protein
MPLKFYLFPHIKGHGFSVSSQLVSFLLTITEKNAIYVCVAARKKAIERRLPHYLTPFPPKMTHDHLASVWYIYLISGLALAAHRLQRPFQGAAVAVQLSYKPFAQVCLFGL